MCGSQGRFEATFRCLHLKTYHRIRSDSTCVGINCKSCANIQTRVASKETFSEKTVGNNLFGLSCRVFRLQIELCQNGMATQRYFLLKKKKRKMKTVGVSMKPRIYVKKLDEFISGKKRLNCCGNRVK